MQERAERTRSRLVRAAAVVFDEQGLAAANVEDISQSAGVSKGALYFHFPSKDHLADAVRGACADRLTATVTRRLDEGEPPLGVLMDLPRLVAGLLARDEIVRAGLRLGRERGIGEYRTDLCRELQALMQDLLQSAAQRRQVRDGLPLRTCAWLLTGFLFTLERRVGTSRSEQEVLEFIEEVWSVLLPGLSGRPGEREFMATAYSPSPSKD